MAQTIDWGIVQDDVARHLQAMIRINTTNPPGNETSAAAYIADVVRAAGIQSEIVEPEPGRGTVVARLRSARPTKAPLLLMGHTDVVGVEHEGWTRDPFGGEIADGCIWGRGALDMKDQVAAELVVLLLLKSTGVTLDRDIILAAFADEEAGGELGAAWMWEHRRNLIEAEYAINEGGGRSIATGNRRVYLCQVGEKGVARLKLTAHGEPGHASTPRPNSAMSRMGDALVRLHTWQAEVRLTPAVRQMLETIAGVLDGDDAARVRQALANPTPEALAVLPLDADAVRGVNATSRDTAVPTVIHGGHRINVIPSEVTLEIDGRILPGTEPEEWRRRVQGVVGDNVDVELLSRNEGIEAEPASPLFDAIDATISAMDPKAVVAPYLSAGGTDARHLPGIKVYGFFPYGPSDHAAGYSQLVHGHDERIGVEDLAFGTRFLYELVLRFCKVDESLR
jgi:acetylornithine deacetylase/succinyl-diaminopimelate desuccinylase-like protein